jgi:hypothetical protein
MAAVTPPGSLWAQEPISVPRHPFWTVLSRFGGDEIIAAIINILATAVVALFSANALTLALAGPIVEKIGFFPAHFWEAWKIYRTTPPANRKKLRSYIRHALAGGSVSLVEDILVHDPCYTILMLLGLRTYPQAPVWILAAISFAIAVIIVSFLETSITELRFSALKRCLLRNGFGSEAYFEARFLISREGRDPEREIADLAIRFGLSVPRRLEYHDLYLGHRLPMYSGRKPKMRLRDRTTGDGGKMRSLQVVYTKASEVVPQRFDQCRFFPVRKNKMYFPLSDGEGVPELKPVFLRRKIGRAVAKPVKELRFTRLVANNKQLLLSVDIVGDDRPFYVLELKTHKDIKTMLAAMRTIMCTMPVVQTTQGKSELMGVSD